MSNNDQLISQEGPSLKESFSLGEFIKKTTGQLSDLVQSESYNERIISAIIEDFKDTILYDSGTRIIYSEMRNNGVVAKQKYFGRSFLNILEDNEFIETLKNQIKIFLNNSIEGMDLQIALREWFFDEVFDKSVSSSQRTGGVIHDEWRSSRQISSQLYEPRWKVVKNREFILVLERGFDKGQYRKKEDGVWEVDIANTDFNDLSPDWQESNKASAEFVMVKIFEYGWNPQNIILDEVFVQKASRQLHAFWLARNSWALEDPLMRLSYDDMKKISEGEEDSLNKVDIEEFKKVRGGSGIFEGKTDNELVEFIRKTAYEEAEKDTVIVRKTITIYLKNLRVREIGLLIFKNFRMNLSRIINEKYKNKTIDEIQNDINLIMGFYDHAIELIDEGIEGKILEENMISWLNSQIYYR